MTGLKVSGLGKGSGLVQTQPRYLIHGVVSDVVNVNFTYALACAPA